MSIVQGRITAWKISRSGGSKIQIPLQYGGIFIGLGCSGSDVFPCRGRQADNPRFTIGPNSKTLLDVVLAIPRETLEWQRTLPDMGYPAQFTSPQEHHRVYEFTNALWATFLAWGASHVRAAFRPI